MVSLDVESLAWPSTCGRFEGAESPFSMGTSASGAFRFVSPFVLVEESVVGSEAFGEGRGSGGAGVSSGRPRAVRMCLCASSHSTCWARRIIRAGFKR